MKTLKTIIASLLLISASSHAMEVQKFQCYSPEIKVEFVTVIESFSSEEFRSPPLRSGSVEIDGKKIPALKRERDGIMYGTWIRGGEREFYVNGLLITNCKKLN